MINSVKMWLEDGEQKTNIEHKIICHSPTGFSWGYLGSGCAELSLNVLIHFVSEEEAYRLHQLFKEDFIASIPEEGGEISKEQILEWLDKYIIK